LLATALPSTAHELWIEPQSFEAEIGAPVNAALINGQNFEGTSLAYSTRSIERLEMLTAEGVSSIQGMLGDRPAIQIGDAQDGLLVLGYQSKPSRLTYKSWDKFLAFADNKGLADPEQAHRAMDIPFENFHEGYTRYSKSLVAIGSSAGQDRSFGFETEFVALLNPYTDDLSDGFPIQFRYLDQPKTDALVQIFVREPSGTVTIENLHTNSSGIVVLNPIAGNDYMLDAVTFRAPSAELLAKMDIDWETLWANLTFSVPQ